MSPRALTDAMLLEIGVPAGAGSSGSGAATDSLARLVNGALAAGTLANGLGIVASQRFSIPGCKDGVLTLTADIGAGVASFKVDLERSIDNGANWKTVQAGIDLFTTNEARVAIGPGGLYRLDVTTFGTPAATSVYGSFAPVG